MKKKKEKVASVLQKRNKKVAKNKISKKNKAYKYTNDDLKAAIKAVKDD